MKKETIDIITMGCSKNLVDSEKLIFQLSQQGYIVRHNPEQYSGQIAVVNTCGFIGDAKEESINMILYLCERKKNYDLKKLYVMGCLSERYSDELKAEIPLVDKFYGKFNWPELLKDLGKSYNPDWDSRRYLTTGPHYAYIKISEGCNRKCAYCAIPIITGAHRSRRIEDILSEVEALVKEGVSEFQIIAQELTYYGLDLYKEQKIADLIDRMSQIPGVKWIRLHYAYPTHFPLDLLDVMNKRPNICKYLDIALQHISTPVLERMQRHTTKQETYQLITKLREKVPGICLRTTFMVGFPGETEEQFEELLDFVKWAKFERMGAFAYSEEEGTYAAQHYEDDIPDAIKQERLDRLMRVQQQISTAVCQSFIGKTLKVIIDRQEGEFYIGRTEYDSPEVDGEVLIPVSEQTLEIGHFYPVKITNADEFDLYGSLFVNE